MAESVDNPERRGYLEFLGRCDQAFTPFAPIELPDFFAGRLKHLERLQSEVDAPGRQVALFGERGVGKTSLAKLAYFFLGREEEHSHFVRCERSSTFDAIFSAVLASAGIEVVLNGMESEGDREGRIGMGPLMLGGMRRIRKTFRRLSVDRRIEPRLLLEHLGRHKGLVIIDEYDRVEEPETHTRVAELIKHFSDARAETKILLVGVAESLSQLLSEHESLSRSLAQIRLDRMSEDELQDIVERGEKYSGAVFKEPIRKRIVRLADGFPYFVHLLCRHACKIAGSVLLKNPKATVVIAEEEYRNGLAGAIVDAEHTLAEQYEQAIVTTRRKSEKFELVLWAMALSETKDVQVQDIAQNVAFFTGEGAKLPSTFSWNLGELVSSRRSRILTKVREGYYKFTNPLMRPYIRFVLEQENILVRGGQWEFPFMREKR